MLVRECLRKAPVTVPPECTLEEAAALMGSHDVGSLLVASGGELLGISHRSRPCGPRGGCG